MDENPIQISVWQKITERCHTCNEDSLESYIAIANKDTGNCNDCLHNYKEFNETWLKLTGKEATELKNLKGNPKAIEKLKRIFVSYSMRGVHKPLILPSAIKIEVTKRCNLSCKHCLASSENHHFEEIPLPRIISLIDEANEMGIKGVGLVGGEPFLRKDLPQIIDVITAQNMYFSISTNGTVVNQKILQSFNRKNLLKISVSIDGEPDYHNMIRGSKTAFDHAIRGIKAIKALQIPVTVAMVVTKKNVNSIKYVIDKMIDLRVDNFVINDLIPIGRGSEIRELCLEQDEYVKMTNTMRMYRKQYEGKINILWKGMTPDGKSDDELGQFFNSKCGAALTELTIDNEGYILPCPFLPKTNENIHQRSLKDIWYHSEELAIYQKREEMNIQGNNCKRLISCSGCRARALGHTGQLNGPDIRCPLNFK